jgi:protocatechuate 3,4-dioxygenase beta subunit
MAPEDLTRRRFFAVTGAAGLAGAIGALGCGDDGDSATTAATPAETTTGEQASRACQLTPEQTEGPYYLAENLMRRDITEGRPGVPLELRLSVWDAPSCDPIEGATVELWQCDALGVYSGVEGEAVDERFLRGGQRTGADGVATFDTIYPGWYPGRTTHIHVKVHAGGDVVHTGQLYFDETVTRVVYEREPYAGRGQAETGNGADGIFGSGGDASLLELAEEGDGYVGRLVLGVRS